MLTMLEILQQQLQQDCVSDVPMTSWIIGGPQIAE